MKVGFIGLGTLGAAMSRHLIQASHPLVVHDLRPEAAEPLLQLGATWADTPAQVARQTESLFLSLPGPVQVEEVLFGSGGGWKAPTRT